MLCALFELGRSEKVIKMNLITMLFLWLLGY